MIPLLFLMVNKYEKYTNPQKDRFVLHDKWGKTLSNNERDEILREVFGGE